MTSSAFTTTFVLIVLITQCTTQRPSFDFFRPPKNRPISSPKNGLIFPTDTPARPIRPSTTTTEYPTTRRTTTMTPCERQCSVTQEFNPVCGSNGENYSNPGKLKCAQNCGKRVSIGYYGQCRVARTPRTTQSPLFRFFQ